MSILLQTPPPDFWRDSIWQSISVIVGSILTVVSIIFGIYYARKQREIKSLVYEVVTNSPLITRRTFEQAGEHLRVSYRGHDVTDIRLIVLRLLNNGNRPIAASTISSPIRFLFGREGEVVDFSVTSTSPTDVLHRVVLRNERNMLLIEPLLLNPKDNITLRVLTTDKEGPISVISSIEGVSSIREVEFSTIGESDWIAILGIIVTVLIAISYTWIPSNYLSILFLIFIILGILSLSRIKPLSARYTKKDN